MQIRIPHHWLLDHLETKATPAQIQKYLSLAGPSIERIYDIGGDAVYDIEITTNRVDSMSVRGIAREAATILSQAGLPSTLKPLTLKPIKVPSQSTLDIQIENDATLCRRVLCALVRDVKHKETPDWMQDRLSQVEIGIHEASIDLTNYVTHDLGFPCHAFDYDKIKNLGAKIKIKIASPNVPFTTLDGLNYVTCGTEVVFENDAGQIIDLPGIKGTLNTAVDENTKNVFFFIESVDPKHIRSASMHHAIRTVAAKLNEKDIDPHMALPVFQKGLELFETLTDGKVESSSIIDIFPKKQATHQINVDIKTIENYLGMSIPTSKICQILDSLGFSVVTTQEQIKVKVPTFRRDVTIPVDIIEEIARIYGYHNLPSVLMEGKIPTSPQPEINFSLEHDVKLLLASLGGFEVYTYSMIDETTANLEGGEHIKLINPLTDDMVFMRRTLWASHTKVLETQNPAFVFELANTYLPPNKDDPSLVTEKLHLNLTTTQDELRLKGVLNAVLGLMYLPQIRFLVKSGEDTLVMSKELVIGKIISRQIGSKHLTAIQLDWLSLVTHARKYPEVKPLPKVAPIIEDMTFTITGRFFIQDVMDEIKDSDPLITKVEYTGKFKQNVSFRIYFQPKKEMSTTQLSPWRKKIVRHLAKEFQAELIGKI